MKCSNTETNKRKTETCKQIYRQSKIKKIQKEIKKESKKQSSKEKEK